MTPHDDKTKTRQNIFLRLWTDECGALGSAELVLLVTILAIGIVVGAKAFRDTALTELADFAQAIGNLDQSYNVPDILIENGPGTADDQFIIGSGFQDLVDFCDEAVGGPTSSSNGVKGTAGGRFEEPIEFAIAPTGE